MSKPFHQKTKIERIRDRIAKSRVIGGRTRLSLGGIVVRLNAGKQRASYGAVAALVGGLPRGLMHGRIKSRECSWVVAATTTGESVRGWPTGYTQNQVDPDCLRQFRETPEDFIEDGETLRRWLGSGK